MKKIFLLLMVLLVAPVPGTARHAESRDGSGGSLHPMIIAANEKGNNAYQTAVVYDPLVNYPGIYEKYRIYKKRYSDDIWKSSTKPAKVFSVTCPDAAQSLSTTGSWTGNLNRDGSCGPKAEPAEWATGNYLNSQATPDEQ